jgi:hypothetical protein
MGFSPIMRPPRHGEPPVWGAFPDHMEPLRPFQLQNIKRRRSPEKSSRSIIAAVNSHNARVTLNHPQIAIPQPLSYLSENIHLRNKEVARSCSLSSRTMRPGSYSRTTHLIRYHNTCQLRFHHTSHTMHVYQNRSSIFTRRNLFELLYQLQLTIAE